MKRKLVAALMVAMLGITQCNAQWLVKNLMEHMYGGAKVESNASNFFLPDMDGMSSKMNMGGSAGGFLGLKVSERFSIQEDFLMHYQTSQLERNGQKGDFNYLGAECTLYAMGNWRINGEIVLWLVLDRLLDMDLMPNIKLMALKPTFMRRIIMEIKHFNHLALVQQSYLVMN